MNYSYGSNADQYLNKDGLEHLIEQLDLRYSGDSGTVDLTDYYNKAEIDNLLANIDGGTGSDGRGIQSVELVNYELIITLTDATVINLGNVRGEQGLQGIDGVKGDKGDKGEQGVKGIDGTNGIDGKDGVDGLNGTNGIDGVSPTITVATNTDTVYSLSITDTNGTITTPNLKGQDGQDGKDGADGDGGGSSGGTGNSNIYSTTEEQEIGTWINGKPIYRKVIDIGVLETANINKPHGIVGIDEITNITQRVYAVGKWFISGGQVKTYATSNYNRNNESLVGVNETTITINAGDDMVGNPYMIIIEYTKV